MKKPSLKEDKQNCEDKEQLSLMSYDNGGANVDVKIKKIENISSKKSEPSIVVASEKDVAKQPSSDGESRKLAVLIDGSGFVSRAFYALPPLTNSKGEAVGAVYGFCSMLLSLLDKHTADLLCVAFDAGRDTFRKQLYSEYKNNREETPAELKSQFPLLIKACDAFGLPTVELEGYEADDIIATYAAKLSSNGYEVRIVSSDKDLMQLVTDNIYLFDPIKSKVIKRDEVFEK